jgi:hypothetical protein
MLTHSTEIEKNLMLSVSTLNVEDRVQLKPVLGGGRKGYCTFSLSFIKPSQQCSCNIVFINASKGSPFL